MDVARIPNRAGEGLIPLRRKLRVGIVSEESTCGCVNLQYIFAFILLFRCVFFAWHR